MRRPALGIAAPLLTIAVGVACRAGAFACEEDEDCANGGAAGVCEAVGACSFVDDECSSGRRYGDRSPDDLAGECVELDGTSGSSSTSSTDTGPSLEVTTAEPTDTLPMGETGEACPGDWWDCGWQRRVALDLPATAGATFVDVPVLVALGAPRIDPSDVASGGKDLRFVTTDGTRVPHEIERWDPVGTSIVWIAVPTLGPGDGPRLWLYYGNAEATDDQDGRAVWSSEYAGVWHLQPVVVDSTGNADHGIATKGVMDVEGHLAGAKEFFAESDRIDVPSVSAQDDAFFGGATISAWARPDTFGGTSRGRIADKSADSPGGWMFFLSDDNGGELAFRYGYEVDQGVWRSDGHTIVDDTWYHVTLTFDAVEAMPPRMWIDGVEQPVVLDEDPPTGAPVSDVGLDIVIGNSDVPNRWFDGRIDELRLERTQREPEWIELQYRSMTDMLVVYSAPERLEDAL